MFGINYLFHWKIAFFVEKMKVALFTGFPIVLSVQLDSLAADTPGMT